MGSTGNNSGMIFCLEANDENEAALIEIALEDSGCEYKIISATQRGNLLGKIEGSLVFDNEDTITNKVIRFVIEPNSNPVQQGYEVAGIVNVLRNQLIEMSSDPEQLEFQIQMEQARETDPETKARFEMLKAKFAAALM
jgi:hypothetical protein